MMKKQTENHVKYSNVTKEINIMRNFKTKAVSNRWPHPKEPTLEMKQELTNENPETNNNNKK